MLEWMQKLVDAVPQEWSPNLSDAQPRERVLGKLPANIWKAFLGAMFALEEAKRIAEEHAQTHVIDNLPAGEDCIKAREESEQLERRGTTLMNAVTEAVMDHFIAEGLYKGLREGSLDVRTEGVVLVPRESPLGNLGDLLDLLAGFSGDRRGGGDEGFFDLDRPRRRGVTVG